MERSDIQKIVDEARKRGHDVRIRDVAYALLKARFGDSLIPYTVVFGQPQGENDVTDYDALKSTEYLVRTFTKELTTKNAPEKDEGQALLDMIFQKRENKGQSDITFEENKAAIIELIERTETALGEGVIKTDVGLKIIADLRVKLNDKFGAAEKTEEQYIIVAPKFNHICDQTHKECWLQTKEFAMQHWHLLPDPNYKQ